MGAARAPWFVEAFRASYRAVYPHRDLQAARREVAHLCGRGLSGRVLDAGCGFGRHAIAMAEQGLDPWGLDLSEELLAEAPGEEGGERLVGRLLRGDLRRLPCAHDAFDGMTLLFSSFGYFSDDENWQVLGEAARVLRPGGLLFLDLMNPQLVRGTLVPHSERHRAGWTITERRSLSSDGRRVRKQVRLRDAEGLERSWREDVRLYGTEELLELAEAAGLELVSVEGDYLGGIFDAQAERQIVCLRSGRYTDRDRAAPTIIQ
ncbi:MAG: class I SAM-dependent methyltransferase [Planctomycetota bacterium]|jgi:SAM-dependent methyltransferase|nr:class I SAM-dependent methyltransferase [Planctomycetota bacterium]